MASRDAATFGPTSVKAISPGFPRAIKYHAGLKPFIPTAIAIRNARFLNSGVVRLAARNPPPKATGRLTTNLELTLSA
jgi:hypothetical protein